MGNFIFKYQLPETANIPVNEFLQNNSAYVTPAGESLTITTEF